MTAKSLTDVERIKLRARVGSVFSPSAPIDRLALFAGRIKQVRSISEAIATRGRHAIMYGDRGVGKTSLATVLNDVYSDTDGIRIAKINCVENDNFENVWKKMFEKISIAVEYPATAGQARPETTEHTLDQFIPETGHFGPGEVRRLCEYVCQGDFSAVLVFDEFDRLDGEDRSLFADTIKDLSDNSIDTTLVLVGVANDVLDLIREHSSIDRCLVQIHMPLMRPDELRQIIDKSLGSVGMTIDNDAAELIVLLSQGLPNYTHLIGQESAYRAVDDGRTNVTLNDVNGGIQEALQKTQQTVKSDYHKASQGQRKGTLYPAVLLACAMAQVDELGYFSSTDVRWPLREITSEDYDIPNFSQHLNKLSTDTSRGPVLEKRGTTRRFRFRFRNPLLRPYIIMKGLIEERISGSLISKMRESTSLGSNEPTLLKP